MQQAEAAAREALADRPVEDLPHVAAWREAYRSFGSNHYTGPPRLLRATGQGPFDTTSSGETVVQHPDAGEVVWCDQLAVAPLAEAPMQLVQHARALAGRGLEGDRYANGSGTFSPRGAHRPGYELTLIAAEVVEDLTTRDAALDFTSTRRNVLTRGIDVNALVGRDFTIGDVRCRGLRLAEPCAHLERLSGPGLLRPLIHRGGLRADVLSGGHIGEGSAISTC